MTIEQNFKYPKTYYLFIDFVEIFFHLAFPNVYIIEIEITRRYIYIIYIDLTKL